MINKQTTLDLNGPQISFTIQPSSVTIDSGGSANFVGVATATFPSQTPTNPATNTGSISYRWYADGYGALSDGSIPSLGFSVAGSATTTLNVINATGPTANGKGFYLVADYTPSAYSLPVGSAVTVGTAKSTGNAFNEPKSSNIATLTVNTTISITSHPSDQEVAEDNFATFTASGSSNDGTAVSIRWLLNGSYLSDNGSTIFGSNTNTLTISLPNASQNLVWAEISHPTASNSPLTTNSALFNVVVPRALLNYESFEDGGSSLKDKGSIDLTQQPGNYFEFGSSSYSSTSLYASEKDIDVRITLAGAAGGSNGSYQGGCGGITVFDLTLEKNVEYILKIGSVYGLDNYPAGGWSNGGGMSIFYKQAQVIAVSGGGGGAGIDGSGGSGGSAGESGAAGGGQGSGAGGISVSTGALGTDGYWQGQLPTQNSSPIGGKLSSCTIGKYWRDQGYSPCENMGNVQLYNVNGNIFSGSATIQRGFKPGLGYRNNGGVAPSTLNGAGGGGAYGGSASTGQSSGYRSGGGGGSGYWNGEGSLISATRGGNCNARGYVKIELPPAPPPPVIPAPTITLTVSPSSISQGEGAVLSWSSTNATSVSSSNFGATTVNGTISVNPSQTTTYTITVSGSGGSASASATVTVTCSVPTVSSTYGTGFQGYLLYGNGKKESAFNGSSSFITSLKGQYNNVTITSAAGFNSTYTSVAQTIFNFYGSNIGRYPDSSGFDYWINDFRNGQYTSLSGLASVIDSAYRAPGGESDYQAANGGLVGNYDVCDNKRL